MPEPAVGVRYAADATPQKSARLAALLFVLDCHAKKKAAYAGRLDDAKEIKNDSRHEHHNK